MIDAIEFGDAYIYEYDRQNLSKMNQISLVTIPSSPYYIDPSIFGEVIGIVPCIDGIVYFVKIPKEHFSTGPLVPIRPETPRGANGPSQPNLELIDRELEHSFR